MSKGTEQTELVICKPCQRAKFLKVQRVLTSRLEKSIIQKGAGGEGERREMVD